jgi:hypothetical protein
MTRARACSWPMPTAFGGRAEDAFHVVCPSLPGFAFSGKPTSNRMEPADSRSHMGLVDGPFGV